MNKKKMNGKFIGLFACLVMLLAVSGICVWNVTNPDKYDTAMLVEEKQTLNEDQMVELTRKTVLVCANDEFDASNSNAVETSQSGNIWSLTYDSTKAAEEAYEMYSTDTNVVFCEYDTTLKTQTLDETDTDESNSDITKDSLVESHLEHTDSPEIYENILSSLDDETYEKTEKAVIVVIDSGATGSYENAYNAFDGSNDVTDTVGHGTQMISTITDMLSDYNGSYEIVPVKVANENGVGSITALIRAFEYASDLNATVVNLSLTSLDNADSYILEEYIAKLGHNGTVVVTSAGNFSDDTSNYVPAKFEDAIVVGSCDENGELASFSNYGTSVDWLVDSDSTSEAAAIMSSLYAKAYLDDVHPLEIMSESDVVYSYVYDAIPDEGQDVNHVSLYDETAYASSDLNLDRFVDKELWWCANYSCTCDEDSYTQYSCNGCASMNATITVKNTYGSGDVEVRVEQDTSSSNVKTIAYIKQNGTSNYPVGSENKEEGHITRHGKVTITNSGNDTIIKFINCDVAGVTPFIYILPNVRPGYTVSSIVPTGEASDYYTHYCKSGNKAMNGWHAGYVDYRNGGYYSYAGALNKTNEYTIYYTANNYSVAYNANGGTGSMSNSSHTYDTAKNLTANSFTRAGYTFAGWNTKSNGTGTAYADKASVKNLTTTNGGTVTLYAQWKPKTTKVTFHKNDGTSDTASQSFTYDATGTKKFGYKTDGTPLWTQTGQFGGWDRTGYTLLGWAKSSTGEKAYSTYSDVANWWILENYSSINLYAVWQPKTTTVTFHKNDGTSDTATQLFTYAATGTKKFGYKTDGTPLWTQTGQFGSWNKTGWTLQGWSHTSTGKRAYSIYNDVEDWWINQYYSSKDLYGVWTPNTYTITYNPNKPSSASNSVTGSTSSSSHTYDTAKTLTSNGYKLTGWTFTGWNTKADGSGTSYANKASVKNLTTTNGGTVTLYAQWVQNTLTIQFHASGGTSNSTTYYVGSDSLIYITESKKLRTTSWKYESASIDLYNISRFGLSKTGYHIASNDAAWLIGSASGSSITQNATTDTTDLNRFKSLIANGNATVTLYANWTPNTYTIAYNSNKPSSASHDITGSTSSSSHVYDTAKALTRNGYKLTGWMFAGWNTKADGSGTAYANKASVKNLTTANGATVVLYAQWTANKYTVVYDINKPSNASHDVTCTMANSTYTYDVSSALRPNTYALVGWTFTGWNTKADGSGTTYANKATVLNWTATDGATITLYAQWKANTYSVKYDKNKPSTASSNVAGSMANTIHTYDTASALRTNTYALVGWTFTGWNTKADGSGTSYANKASVSTLSSTEGATVTLYAQWRQNTYTVVYDKNRPTVATHGIQASNTVTGSMANTSHTYDKNTALRTNVYKLTGWTFKEWNTKADGSGTTVTTGLNLTPVDKGTVTLYAIWTPNQYLIRFLQNDGGTGVVDGEMASMTATYDVPMNLTLNSYVKTTPGGIEYRDGEVVTKKSLFKGWNRESDVFTATFADGATVLNLESEQGAIVNLYAIWDDTPSFTIGEYPDRYFTLREAQNGEITEEELLSTIVVYDRETNPLVKKTSADVAHTGNDVGLTIVGYQASDFTSLTGDTKISVRYQLKDESYLTAYLNITVSVNEMDPTVEPIVNYTRSMSEDYYQDDAGSYVMADVGGLNEKSRWITDTYYSSLLTKALQSVEEIPESELVFKQSFSSEDMQNMRNYVNTNGFGNSENPNGLQNFYNLLVN